MHWLNSSLNRKFIAGTALGLLMSSLLFLILFVTMYRNELEAQGMELISQVNSLLQTSLENAMLKQDLQGLSFIVDRLGEQANITGVMIANPAGQIRFSSDRTLLGRELGSQQHLGKTPSTRFTFNESGREVLQSINPVLNKPSCSECHGPVNENPVNGILYVDYDASSIRHQARLTTLLLMGSGALIVVLNLAGGWWFIHRFVIKPMHRLSFASDALAKGALDTRVQMQGEDELARFGNTFNRMAASLQTKIGELHEKEIYLQALIDAIPDGVRVIDGEYRIQVANRSYFEQLGLPSDPGAHDLCYASSHHRDSPCPATLMTCPVHEIRQNPAPLRFVHRHKRDDGASMDVEVFAAPMRITRGGVQETLVVESIRDLTEEIRFSHEQKLSELGRLAAGVAHEIHNPLTSVRLALHAALRSNEAPEDRRDDLVRYLELVDRQVDACIEVTERLLKLSAAPSNQREIVAVKQTVEETVSLLQWDAKEAGIEIDLQLEPPTVRILATDSELRMLTLNLVQNAFHAMPSGGKLTVSAAREGGFVVLRFTDTGVGIPPERLPSIFDPFFSRRADESKGLGLGLPICRAIVNKYGGTLEVENAIAGNTCFKACLPDAESVKEV